MRHITREQERDLERQIEESSKRVAKAARKESERREQMCTCDTTHETGLDCLMHGPIQGGEIMDRKDCLVVRELKGGTHSKEQSWWYLFDAEREPTTESVAIATCKETAARSPGIRIGVAKLIFEARMTGMESGGFKAEFEK